MQGFSDQSTWQSSLLVPLSLAEFRKHFSGRLKSLCRPLSTFYSPKVEHKHPAEHQVVGELVAEGLHEVVRENSAPS